MVINLNSKFAELWSSKNRYILITGGRGSSKSFSVATYLVDLAVREPKQTILFTRYTLTTAHISIIPEYEEKIDLLGYNKIFKPTKTEIECANGSNILFRGIRTSSGNQTANLKSIQGVTTWVLDEAEELIDEKIFDKIDDSIRAKTHHNRIILILNPTTYNHWIFKRFFETKHPNVTYIHTSYMDNIDNLSETFLNKIEQVKRANYDIYRHRYLGEWMDKAEGVVFNNWRFGTFDDTCPSILWGQDYGYSNDPTTLIKVGINKKEKKIYIDECFYLPMSKLSTEQIYELNKTHAGKGLIVADRDEGRLIDELKAKGLNIVRCFKPAGSIISGIMLLKDYELIVTERSNNVANEFRNYVWLDRGSQMVIDDFNHTIDPLRYVAQYAIKNENYGKYTIGFA